MKKGKHYFAFTSISEGKRLGVSAALSEDPDPVCSPVLPVAPKAFEHRGVLGPSTWWAAHTVTSFFLFLKWMDWELAKNFWVQPHCC